MDRFPKKYTASLYAIAQNNLPSPSNLSDDVGKGLSEINGYTFKTESGGQFVILHDNGMDGIVGGGDAIRITWTCEVLGKNVIYIPQVRSNRPLKNSDQAVISEMEKNLSDHLPKFGIRTFSIELPEEAVSLPEGICPVEDDEATIMFISEFTQRYTSLIDTLRMIISKSK